VRFLQTSFLYFSFIHAHIPGAVFSLWVFLMSDTAFTVIAQAGRCPKCHDWALLVCRVYDPLALSDSVFIQCDNPDCDIKSEPVSVRLHHSIDDAIHAAAYQLRAAYENKKKPRKVSRAWLRRPYRFRCKISCRRVPVVRYGKRGNE
jgi:hypothetical protein